MDVAELFKGLRIPPDLVVEFFVVFARFEFALKEAGYVSGARGYSEPDWRRFGREVAAAFQPPTAEESAAFDVPTTQPPLRQVFRDNRLTWEPMPLRGPPVVRALEAAKRVRNNLFHGGKHTPHSPEGRDAALVSAALTLLNACLQRHERVREAFDQPQSN